VAGTAADKETPVFTKTVTFPHNYYYYYGKPTGTSSQRCDGRSLVCYRDYCQLGVSSCFNTTGAPAAVSSIIGGPNSTALDGAAGNSKNITAAALAASPGMPPLQLVPCPPRRCTGKPQRCSTDWTECYTAKRDKVVYFCNGMRSTADTDGPIDASCARVLSAAELAQLQAEAAARARNAAVVALPLVSVGAHLNAETGWDCSW
jgi:hypothetical protein